jgi:hypothetical protein
MRSSARLPPVLASRQQQLLSRPSQRLVTRSVPLRTHQLPEPTMQTVSLLLEPLVFGEDDMARARTIEEETGGGRKRSERAAAAGKDGLRTAETRKERAGTVKASIVAGSRGEEGAEGEGGRLEGWTGVRSHGPRRRRRRCRPAKVEARARVRAKRPSEYTDGDPATRPCRCQDGQASIAGALTGEE